MAKRVTWDDFGGRARSFDARYPGNCAGCRFPFDAGDPVYYVDDQLYAEDGCIDEDGPSLGIRTSGTVRPICIKCRMELPKSGICDCGGDGGWT